MSNSPSTPTPFETPLTQANPQSLETLFNKDPLTLTESDIEIIILKLREERARWNQEENKKKSAPKTPKTAATQNLTLGDLDL